MDLDESPMGCTHSQETHSPRQPSSSPPPAPFKFPLSALAPFHSAQDTAERTIKAEAGWKKKRADSKQEWSLAADGETYVFSGGYEGKRVVLAEGQYADELWGVSDDRVDTAELQYYDEEWSASDDRVDTAEFQYCGEEWRTSDDRVDTAELQYCGEEWCTNDDRIDTAELQYYDEEWCTSDVRVDTAESHYADDKWSASDDRADEALEASGMKIDS
ncbi:hypothetical protein G7Y79_00002g008170 [Physcia stellaris]|nr:hypothetical protein G7Y79_00002g008170 [Physcia stellaris]